MSKEIRVTIRLTEVERDKIKTKADKEGKLFSVYLRDKVLTGDNELSLDIDSIKKDLTVIRKNQLEIQSLQSLLISNVKKILSLNIFLASSLFQIKYLTTHLFNLFISSFRDKLPANIEIPSDQKKQFYIQDNLNEMNSRLEEVR